MIPHLDDNDIYVIFITWGVMFVGGFAGLYYLDAIERYWGEKGKKDE